MRSCFCLLSLLAAALCQPGNDQTPPASPEVKELMRQFEKDEAAIRDKAEAELQTRRGKLLQDLKSVQEKYTKAGQLDEALAVRELVRAFQRELPRTPIKAGTGTIKGKVVFSGTPPPQVKNELIQGNDQCRSCIVPPDKLYWECDQKWIIGKDKGVANVLVRLKVPAGSYFAPSEKTKPDVTIDQPCCNFDPRVVAVYPAYFDGKTYVPTGQKLIVKNSAPFNHNVKMIGVDPRAGNDSDRLIPSGGELKLTFNIPSNPEINVSCSIHPWMSAKFFVYDHPYAVVTGLDGTFELKNVPIGTPLTLEFWHEGDVIKSETVTLSDKEVKDFKDIPVSK